MKTVTFSYCSPIALILMPDVRMLYIAGDAVSTVSFG